MALRDISERNDHCSTTPMTFGNFFFWLPAARVRLPGGSPFSQLHQREKDNSTFVKSNKNIHVNDQMSVMFTSSSPCSGGSLSCLGSLAGTMKRINQTKSNEKNLSRKSASETRGTFGRKRRNRRREAIGFEIPRNQSRRRKHR